jgi:hypothetical protein
MRGVQRKRHARGLLLGSLLIGGAAYGDETTDPPGSAPVAPAAPVAPVAPAVPVAPAAPVAPVAPAAQVAPVTTAAPRPVRRQKERGFALTTNLGLGGALIDFGGSGTSRLTPTTLWQVGFGGGYKTGRLLLTVGLDIVNLSSTSSTTMGGTSSSQSTSTTSFLVVPGVQVALLRSPDQRVEMIGAVQIGLGRGVTTTTRDPPTPSPTMPTESSASNLQLSYQVGPGVRAWILPQLAINVLSGVAGRHSFEFSQSGDTRRVQGSGFAGLFGHIGVLGVF